MNNNLKTIKELSRHEIEKILAKAKARKQKSLQPIVIPTTVMNVFVEPSTRTLFSFKRAERELGLKIFDLGTEGSSLKKGETLEDTLLTLEAIGVKNFVIRTNEENYWKKFQYQHRFANAGDGAANHPTQALLDAMTIDEEFGTLENLKILIVGDIPHSRVAGSFKELMGKFNSRVDTFIPPLFGGSDKDLANKVNNYDVVMMLRIQHERHKTPVDIKDYNKHYGLNEQIIKKMKAKSIFMHPGPINRDVEIDSKLLYDHPKCRVLEQVENGVYVRMAVIERLCKNLPME